VLFSPVTGRRRFTVTADHYAATARTVRVTGDHVARLDAALRAGRLSVSPASVSRTVAVGKTATAKLTLKNTGSAPLRVTLTERSGDLPTEDPAGRQVVPGDYSPLPLTSGSDKGRAAAADVSAATRAWTGLADYPTPVMDNAVATGPDGRVYSVGGIDGTSLVTDGYVYDPTTTAWSAMPSGVTTPREAPQSAFLDGKLYVTGGWGADGGTVTATEVYDSQHHTWSTAAPVPAGYAAAASATLDGKWYLVGGCDAQICGSSDVQVYDPATGTWSAAAPYPEAVSWMGCGGISGTLYCAGGTTPVGGTRHGYAYDPASATWTPITDLPFDLWAPAYTAADGRFLLSGGASDLMSGITTAGYAYDPAARTWSALPSASTPVYRAGSACGFYRVGGAPSVFDAHPYVEQLPGLDSCVPVTDVTWLSAAPTTRTLGPGQRLTITVRLDATAPTVDTTGIYTAALAVGTDTPYVYPTVPVSMTVTARR
jgi:N-acetylneuraminic acid mutarotase